MGRRTRALGGRPALWARRLRGRGAEPGTTGSRRPRPELAELLVDGDDLAAIGRMFAQLTEEHGKRMSALGLDSRRLNRAPQSDDREA